MMRLSGAWLCVVQNCRVGEGAFIDYDLKRSEPVSDWVANCYSYIRWLAVCNDDMRTHDVIRIEAPSTSI